MYEALHHMIMLIEIITTEKQVKLTLLDPIDRVSPYLQTPVPTPRWGVQAKHSTNHLQELRKH
jgi:hypothetical protein